MKHYIRRTSGGSIRDEDIGYAIKRTLVERGDEGPELSLVQILNKDGKAEADITFGFYELPEFIDTSRLSTLLELVCNRLVAYTEHVGILNQDEMESFVWLCLGDSWGWHLDNEKMKKLSMDLLPA